MEAANSLKIFPLSSSKNMLNSDNICNGIWLLLAIIGWICGIIVESLVHKHRVRQYLKQHKVIWYYICAAACFVICIIFYTWIIVSSLSRIDRCMNQTNLIAAMLSWKRNKYYIKLSKDNLQSWKLLHHYLVRKFNIIFFNLEPSIITLAFTTFSSVGFVSFNFFCGPRVDPLNANFICWGVLTAYNIVLCWNVIRAGKHFQLYGKHMQKRLDRQMSGNVNNDQQQEMLSLRYYLHSTTIVPKLFGIRMDNLTKKAIIGMATAAAPTIFKYFQSHVKH